MLNGEKEMGVSVVTLAEEFDHGDIIEQEKIDVWPTDTTPTLITKLFALGADLLVNSLPKYLNNSSKLIKSTRKPSYYPRMTRELGFEPWENIESAINDGKDAVRIERKWRALHPWPGLWTEVKKSVKSKQKTVETRMKILECHLEGKKLVLDSVQMEGKTSVSGREFLKSLQSKS